VGDRLDQALVQRIREWKAAGYRVALLSNYTPELDALVDEHRLRQLFDAIVISAHEGVMKPASRLFWRALNRIGIGPAEALFVDDFAENVAGARSVGLYAVQFRDTQKAITEIEKHLL
jgi:epoxide hydrolase-like predicted phosphatase